MLPTDPDYTPVDDIRRSAAQIKDSETLGVDSNMQRQKTNPFSSASEDRTVQGSNRLRDMYDETESILTPAQKSDAQFASDHQGRLELKALPEEGQQNESSDPDYSDDAEF